MASVVDLSSILQHHRGIVIFDKSLPPRAKACALTSSYPGSLHKGFPSYEEAEAYILEHGCNSFFVNQEVPSDRKLCGENLGRTFGFLVLTNRSINEGQTFWVLTACLSSGVYGVGLEQVGRAAVKAEE